ncbi:hypothetical protein ACFL6U_21000 [Planctomycetota bacterium]
MSRAITFLTIGLFLLVLCPVTLGQTSNDSDANANQGDLWSQFKLIVDRNIFSRQRGQRQRPERRSSKPERPLYVATPESTIVLKGVVKDNNQFVAFFEDTRSYSILRIRVGMDVARGKVEALTLDHVVFVHDGKTRIVTVGQNLEGAYGSGNIGLAEVMEWSENTSSSEPTGSSSDPSSAGASDILKQLMERRRQQLGD